MNEDEIKAKKAVIRARFRAGLKSWKPWSILVGGYIVIFVLSYLPFYIFTPKDALPILPILPGIAFLLANVSIAIVIGFLSLLYIFCPVTGRYAMKFRGENHEPLDEHRN